MDSKNDMRITSFKNNDFDFFKDFYIAILIEREKEDLKKICNENRKAIKGQQFLDAGYIYAPYIPIMIPQVIEVPTGLGKTGIMSRYSQKIVNSNLYGTIRVGQV